MRAESYMIFSTKILIFCQKSDFFPKLQIFYSKNPIFRENSDFSPKIRNFPRINRVKVFRIGNKTKC